MTKNHDYSQYWFKYPFIVKNDRAISLICPACDEGILGARFSIKGNNFTCEKCDFVLT